MLLRRVLISKRMETRLLAAAIGQVADMLFSESVGVVSTPSAKRWADSLAKTASASGLGKGMAWLVGSRIAGPIHSSRPVEGRLFASPIHGCNADIRR